MKIKRLPKTKKKMTEITEIEINKIQDELQDIYSKLQFYINYLTGRNKVEQNIALQNFISTLFSKIKEAKK